VIALVVIGPKDLPKVARMAGSLFGRAQRYINEVKSEVSREIELDELRKMQKDVQDAAQNVEQSIAQGMAETESELNSAWHGNDDASAYSFPPTAYPVRHAWRAIVSSRNQQRVFIKCIPISI